MPNKRRFLKGQASVEIGYPWLSLGSIVAIEGRLIPEHTVLEFGCGGSTVFWAKRAKTVRSYEMSLRWLRKVRSAVREQNNVTFVYGDIDTLVNSLKMEPDTYYDWILADIDPYRARLQLLKDSIPKLRVGGCLIVDNYVEELLSTFDYSGFDVYTFDELGYRGSGTRICIKQ